MKTILFLITLIFVQKIHNENDSIKQYTPQQDNFEQEEDLKIQELHKNFEANQCNKEILISYGLNGLAKPEFYVHKQCPYLHNNCCSQKDYEKSEIYWQNSNKKKIETYYNTYIISIRYLLGFYKQINVLAHEFENSSYQKCKSAAEDQISLDFKSEQIKNLFETIIISINKMTRLRENFYCLLCDSYSQASLKDYWSSTNRVRDKVFLSKDFCLNLVKDNIEVSFSRIISLTKYFENISVLINCKKGIPENDNLIFNNLNREGLESIQSCKYFGAKNLFFNCESYCQNFHLTKPNFVLDGNLFKLKDFFILVKENKSDTFTEFNNNVLSENINFDEDFLTDKFKNEDFENYIFFESFNGAIHLDQYETDVVYFGGMNPFSENLKSKNSVYLYENSIFIFYCFKILLFMIFTY